MAKKTKEPKEPANTGTSVLDAIRKKYGAESVQDLSATPPAVEVIPTGSLALDKALGIGGWPRGRIVEVYGPESAGKTTLCLHAIAEAQAMGLKTAMIDAEHALDIAYAGNLDVDVTALLLNQPDYGEQALEITDMLVGSGEFGLVVVDSVAALTPKAELEGEVGDAHVGLQARMMSQSMRKMAAAAHRGDCTVMFINQLRAKIGSFGFGPKETTAGGNALKYFSSVRVDIRRIGSVKVGETVVANRTKVKVAKNKLAPPFKEVLFDITFGIGIDKGSELLEAALEAGVVKQSGAWFTYGDTKLGQGQQNAKQKIMDDPDLRAEISRKVLG